MDETAMRELVLYTDNDSALYRQRAESIRKNLAQKKAKGIYDHTLAVKAFMYLADAGAKKYAREFATAAEWNRIFPTSVRKAAARKWAKEFEAEYRLQNLPARKPATRKVARSPRKATRRSSAR